MEADETSHESRATRDEPRKTGTREWAELTRNIQMGCEHDCRYCYARWNAVTRYKLCSREQWREPHIFSERVDARYHKLEGVVMVSSTHDVTMRNANECLVVLRKLLEAGNEVLIVSKPDWNVIQLVMEALKYWQSQVMFRFTIGSSFDNVLKFWEPGAPNFESRIKSLSCAFLEGWRTSVSCEPYLDCHPAHIVALYKCCAPFLSRDPAGGMWFGMLRHWNSRVDLAGATEQEIKLYVEPLRAAQSDAFVRLLVKELDGKPHVRWKDSIQEVIERQPQISLATESTEDTEDTEKGSVDAQELHQ
jgi:hypothetical protein